jgi:hypothetical protein
VSLAEDHPDLETQFPTGLLDEIAVELSQNDGKFELLTIIRQIVQILLP